MEFCLAPVEVFNKYIKVEKSYKYLICSFSSLNGFVCNFLIICMLNSVCV